MARDGGRSVTGPIPAIPPVKPPLRSFRFAADGRIWALVSMPSQKLPGDPNVSRPGGRASTATANRWIEPTVYDIFEPGGAYVGRVRIPDNVSLRWIRADTVWAVARDENDVNFVRRYQIRWE
jgi:hypothetical protein